MLPPFLIRDKVFPSTKERFPILVGKYIVPLYMLKMLIYGISDVINVIMLTSANYTLLSYFLPYCYIPCIFKGKSIIYAAQ